MMQKYKNLNLPDAFIFIPKKFKDTRGIFFENFNFKSASEMKTLILILFKKIFQFQKKMF